MKIARATFLGLRGLPDATFDLRNPSADEPHSVIVVTGPPASGKTRWLEALAVGKETVAPYAGMVSGEGWVRGADEPAKIVIDWWLSPDEMAFAGTTESLVTTEALFLDDEARAEIDDGVQALLERYEHDHAKGKLEYFPVNRSIPRYGSSHGLEAIQQRLYRTSADDRKYSFIPRLVQSLPRDAGRAEHLATLLGYLSDTVRYAPGPGRDELAVFSTLRGSLAQAHELSSSEADAVIFASTAALIGLSSSVVLVDRPDLHVHPENAARFVQGLAALGKDNQLIVATSSHEILASVDPSQIIRLGRPAAA